MVVETLRWLTGAWLLWRIPGCRGGVAEHGGPVSVVIPARNEAASLPRLLTSLADQDPAPAQVIVVDDHSDDATARVARDGGATLVAAPALPEGWTGKAWACWTGAAVATAPTLVFLDADTVLAPGALQRLRREWAGRGGLVSVQPFHLTERPYESLSAFFNLVAMMGTDAFTPLGSRVAPSGAFGPCLVCSRRDYDGVGGHQAVRAEVLDDVALAGLFRATGRPVACLGGRGTVSFRMYAQGVGQLVEGWSKNFAAGAGATRLVTLGLVVAWLSGCIMAGWGLVTEPSPGAVLVYVAYGLQLWWMLRRVGRFHPGAGLLFPLPLAFFLAVFFRSVVLTHLWGKVPWKGRTVATRSPP